MREIASLKLNMKVCDAIPGTLNVVSEENAAINENNRFTERFNFELAFNLPLSKRKGHKNYSCSSKAAKLLWFDVRVN